MTISVCSQPGGLKRSFFECFRRPQKGQSLAGAKNFHFGAFFNLKFVLAEAGVPEPIFGALRPSWFAHLVYQGLLTPGLHLVYTQPSRDQNNAILDHQLCKNAQALIKHNTKTQNMCKNALALTKHKTQTQNMCKHA